VALIVFELFILFYEPIIPTNYKLVSLEISRLAYLNGAAIAEERKTTFSVGVCTGLL